MKYLVKILSLLFVFIGKFSTAQYNAIPVSPCHIYYAAINHDAYQSYLVDKNNRVYLYENPKATPSSNNGCDISYSDNDNATCTRFYSYAGGVNNGAVDNVILTDTTIIASISGFTGKGVYRISRQGTVTQTLWAPTLSTTNISATDEMLYAIAVNYFPNRILYFVKNKNNINQVDTLKYKNIAATPGLYFANDSTGYLYGKDTLNNAVLLRSYDYGRNWNLIYSPANGVTNIQFKGDTGLAVGYYGYVYKTTDNGMTWTVIPRFTTKHLRSISIGSNEIYAAGDSAALYKSTDFGTTWTQEPLSVTGRIVWVKVTDSGDVYFEYQELVNNYYLNTVYKKNYFASVTEYEQANKLLVIYPNPASNKITIETKEKNTNRYSIYIINNLGEIVLESNKLTLDITSINTGLYTVELKTSEGEVFRSKVLKIDH